MKNALRIAVNWLWNKITHIDYAMIAAAFVEVPRWAVAFAAIREPMWAAFPMGLLLAWAASAGWKAYFEDKSRHLLLIINGASLAGALIVIAPVLYAMTYMPLDEIDLSQVLPPEYLWVWAIVLSITTFVPLVQVAAVKAYQSKPAVTSTVNAPVNGVAQTTTQPPAGNMTPVQQEVTPEPDNTTQDVTPVSAVNKSELARQMGVSRQTVIKWEKDGKLDTMIAQRLPQTAPVYANGSSGHVSEL